MKNTFWKCIYLVNRVFISHIIPHITVASTLRTSSGDEYTTLSGNGWVTVRSKKNKNWNDMIPITMVSDKCVEDLVKSSFFRPERILG
jgi:hypothetical protein